MRRNLLTIIVILLLLGQSNLFAQTETAAQFTVSKHRICIGEPIIFDDATPRKGITNRKWIFPDTVIYGDGINEQITVYRSFYNDTNRVELYIYRTTIDTLVNPENIEDTTFAEHRDTSMAVDTIYAFLHPKMHAIGDSIACEHDPVDITMQPTVNGCTYEWYEFRVAIGTPIAYGPRLNVEPYNDEALYFMRIMNPDGCVLWDSTTVYVMKNSLSTLPENGLICKGDPAILVAGKADHYKWESFPNDPSLDTNDFTHTATPTVYPTYNTVYAMTPYGSNGCAGEQQIVTLNVYHKPVLKVNRVPLTLDPDNPTMNFVDQSEYSVKSYWIFGDGEHAVGANVSHYFSETQFDTTEVLLQSTNEIGCTVDTTIRIPIQKFASWAPNVFTPNRAENNTFQIRTINNLEYFKVMIFNRRGMLMFESEDPQFVWDGTHNNKDCPQDTYVYICRYRKAGTGETTLKKGVVTILR